MTNLSHIVVGTDFSAPAQRAVSRATAIAAEHDATLDIVHARGSAFERLLERMSLTSRRDSPLPEARRRLDTAVEEASDAGVTTSGHIYGTSRAAALERHVEDTQADLVVLGDSLAQSLPRLLGNTAERMVKAGAPKILVCRLDADLPYRRILACVALAPISPRVVEEALRLSRTAEVTAFHATSVPFERKLLFSFGARIEAGAPDYSDAFEEEAHAELEELLEAVALPQGRVHTLVRQGRPPQALLNTAFLQRSELIVTGKSKSAVAEHMMGDVARYVLREAACDVMVIND